MTGWRWAAAKARGTSHAKDGSRCQDHFRVVGAGDALLGVVSDGAGSAAHGGAGAALAVRAIAGAARIWLGANAGAVPDDAVVTGWIDGARAAIAAAARDGGPREFACTLVGAIARAEGTLLMLVGDGCVAVRRDGVWTAPGWPEHGEYASTTYFLTDEPAARLRIVRLDFAVDAIALMSDGLERLALDFATGTAHLPFFEAIVRPVAATAGTGRDDALSRALAAYLHSPAINARTDDDKTLVLAVRR